MKMSMLLDSDGRKKGVPPFIIGVAGGSSSGKSSVCEKIMDNIRQFNLKGAEQQILSISQESFYRDLTPKESEKASRGEFNFDHPDAFDMKLMEKCLKDIVEGRPTKIPKYDLKTNSRLREYTPVKSLEIDVILIEGILILYFPEIRDMFNMKMFVETDPDSRLAKRMYKETEELGRNLDQVLNHYIEVVKPAYEDFCLPTKKFADVIIPRGADNKVAIELISRHITELLMNPPEPSRRASIISALEPRKRHFSDTSNMYNASQRRDLMDVLDRPH